MTQEEGPPIAEILCGIGITLGILALILAFFGAKALGQQNTDTQTQITTSLEINNQEHQILEKEIIQLNENLRTLNNNLEISQKEIKEKITCQTN